MSDLPIPTIWRDLASTFPDAHFILTIRAPVDWIESVEWHTRGRQLVPEEQEFYDRSTFDRRSFLSTYVRHNVAVMEHFAGCDNNFLVMDIAAGDGWEKLCRHLGTDVPADVPFPWESASKGG